MKRAKVLSLPCSNIDSAPKKLKVPVLQFIPLESLEMSSPILELHADNSVSVHVTQDMQDCAEEDDETVCNVVEHMDITEPLSTLRSLLEQRLGVDLSGYVFYLQDVQELDSEKNLVNQCVQGEGMVQINVDVTCKRGSKKINILDVLKPAEEITITSESDVRGSDSSADSSSASTTTTTTIPASGEQVTRWVAASDFRQLQESLKISQDPELWTEEHVRLWLRWAATRFVKSSININNWKLDGKGLHSLTREAFHKKVFVDPDDLFWTHFELLRKCKIVAVLQQSSPSIYVPQQVSEVSDSAKVVIPKNKVKASKPVCSRINYEGVSGNNGQIQLWQFLLELLTDKNHRDHIQWVGDEGEFKLINPEMVAHLWGQRKNKPTMNYEKLSRALRYYYDGEMIAKVHGKRFVYKFVCDLKNLLGYSALELNRLVCECELKNLQKGADSVSQ